MTHLKTPFLTLATALALVMSTVWIGPAALAHENASGAKGCHSHEDSGKRHCH